MSAETVHFVLELNVGIITLGVSGLFAYILKMEGRVSKLESKIESYEKEIETLSGVLTWYTRKREGD